MPIGLLRSAGAVGLLCLTAVVSWAQTTTGDSPMQRLESAIRHKDRFAAQTLLVEVAKMDLPDDRIAALRKTIEALPWPNVPVLDLGQGVKMQLLLIRPGTFPMGDREGRDDEQPVHPVKISKPFYIGQYEVTQQQWQAVMGKNPSTFEGAAHPVDHVAWADCQEFLKKLSQRFAHLGLQFHLPTEAQWEYACRAGRKTRDDFGEEDEDLGECAWYSRNSERTTHPVGEKKPNAWALYDMHGNVGEWCADWYGPSYYKKSPGEDPTGPAEGTNRVIRGGSWFSYATLCRSTSRTSADPASRSELVGFRVAGEH